VPDVLSSTVFFQVDVKSEGEYNVIRSSELPVIANKRGSQQTTSSSLLLDPSALWELRNGEHIERDEFHLQRKPKGKAKFIGQSKAEKVSSFYSFMLAIPSSCCITLMYLHVSSLIYKF